MIIYFTVSAYHILKSVLHKQNYHPHSNAILLVPQMFLKPPYGIAQMDTSIFSKIVFYDWDNRDYNKYPEEVFAYIEKILHKECGGRLWEEVEEINVFYAARYFGSYLAYHDIPFNWFEEADGRYSNPYPPMEDDKRLCPQRFNLAYSMGLYDADNTCIQTVFLSLKAQTKECSDPRIVDFDVTKELEKLTPSDREKIMTFWGVPTEKTTVDDNSVLLLSQHFCNIKIISFEEQILMYQTTVDYFLEGYKLYLKLHPSDLVPYKNYLDHVEILDADYPSELLPYAIDGKFCIVAAISSTGVMNLKNISNRQLLLNEDYIHGFMENDRYYFICKVLECFPTYKFLTCGMNDAQLNAIWAFGLEQEINTITSIPTLTETRLKDTIIVLGTEAQAEDYTNLKRCIKENVLIVIAKFTGLIEALYLLQDDSLFLSVRELHLSKIEDSEYSNYRTNKYIYVLSDREENILKADAIHYEKLLLNTGIKVRVDSNWEKDAQISALNGMLEATEAALQQSLIENNELKKKLDETEK